MKSESSQGESEDASKIFYGLCATISKEMDRSNSNHQTLIRFLESILFEIKSEKERIIAKATNEIGSIEEYEIEIPIELKSEIIAKTILGYLTDIKVIVEKAVLEIQNEKSQFNIKFSLEWLPKIRIIFLEVIRDNPQCIKGWRDEDNEEWLFSFISFLPELDGEGKERLREMALSPVPKHEDFDSNELKEAIIVEQEKEMHLPMRPPSSPEVQVLSPKKRDVGVRKVSFDFSQTTNREYPEPPPNSPIKVNSARGSISTVPASTRPRKASLPVKLGKFFRGLRKGPSGTDGEDDTSPRDGSSKSL